MRKMFTSNQSEGRLRLHVVPFEEREKLLADRLGFDKVLSDVGLQKSQAMRMIENCIGLGLRSLLIFRDV